jgi:hypothetical protein
MENQNFSARKISATEKHGITPNTMYNQDTIDKSIDAIVRRKAGIQGLFQAKASRRDQPCLAIER